MTITSARLPLLALASALVIFALAAPSSAGAAKIGAGGTINACYKAKGKSKGALRVVPPAKRCKRKRGERPLAWSVAGAPNTGTVSDNDVFALLTYVQQQQSQIETLTEKLQIVDGILEGVSNGELAGVISKLDGITGSDLQSVVGSLPVISSLCTQLSALTGQADALRTVIGGLGLNGVLTALGGLLQIPPLPDALGPYSCPAT